MKAMNYLRDHTNEQNIIKDSLKDMDYCESCGKAIAPGEKLCAQCLKKVNKAKRDSGTTADIYRRSVDMRNDEIRGDGYEDR